MSFDVRRARRRFPALAFTDDGVPRIYFDNPAGTQVPGSVVEAVGRCMTHASANLGGSFRTSRAADAVVDEAHAAVADLLNASPQEIVFGQNMTSLTLQVGRSIGRTLVAGDEIILTRMDHDANVTPWTLLARDHGLRVRWIDLDTERYELDLASLDAALSERTRLVCIGHASNLLGTVNDVAALSRRAREAGALVYVDAVQSVPHLPVDVEALGCDFLACSAYKFFGPHQGMLWGRRAAMERLEPYRVRPAPATLPGSFETGTQSHEGMAGVTAAVAYLQWLGETLAGARGPRRDVLRAAMEAIAEWEQGLSARLIGALAAVPGVRVRGIAESERLHRRVPTVSVTVDGWHPAELARRLAEENIYTWSGHSYAVEPVRAMGLLDAGGVLRIGLVHYNTPEEIDRFAEALERLVRRGTSSAAGGSKQRRTADSTGEPEDDTARLSHGDRDRGPCTGRLRD